MAVPLRNYYSMARKPFDTPRAPNEIVCFKSKNWGNKGFFPAFCMLQWHQEVLSMDVSLFKLEIFLPEEAFSPVREALFSVDAGHIGNYDRCLSWSRVQSCWRPLAGTRPYLGQEGRLCQAEELKLEVCCRAEKLAQTLAAVRAAHPYEEPVINVLPLTANGLEDGQK